MGAKISFFSCLFAKSVVAPTLKHEQPATSRTSKFPHMTPTVLPDRPTTVLSRPTPLLLVYCSRRRRDSTSAEMQSSYPIDSATGAEADASCPSASSPSASSPSASASLDIRAIPHKITKTKALHLATVIGDEWTVEQLANMANTTVGEMEADLGADFMRCLRLSSATNAGGEWI